MDHEKRSGLSTQPYHMYILVNSGDLRLKLDFYYMRSCISFIKMNTVINEINLTLKHETKYSVIKLHHHMLLNGFQVEHVQQVQHVQE